ncbi:hypothetical protein [Streptomyces sp. NPDC006551]|uniref:hypothetical protein n=1 Tax=Streptomyces sp. NPDC006551 TaxID=3157178 RepID=UPI0033AF0A76
MLLNPEQTLFVRGETPALLLADAPIHDALPVLLTAPDGTVPGCDGWSLVPQLTLCVVDGPAEHGIIIPALAAPVFDGTPEPGDMTAWCEDTHQAGGALVLSLDHLPDVLDWPHLLTSGTTRGGFIPTLT